MKRGLNPMNRDKNLFSRDEMLQMNIEMLVSRGVQVDDIADIAFKQQSIIKISKMYYKIRKGNNKIC